MRRLLVAVLALVVLGAGSRAGAAVAVVQAWTPTSAITTFAPKADHIYVASRAAGEEARAFVGFASGGSTLSLTADDNLAIQAQALVACPLAQALTKTGQLAPADAPAANCTSPVPLASTDGTHWRLDLAQMTGNFGVALLPKPGTTSVWRLGFDAAQTRLDGVTAVPAPTASSSPAPVPASSSDVPTFEVGAVPVAGGTDVAPVTPAAQPLAVALAQPAQRVDRLGQRSIDHPGTLPMMALAFVGVVIAGVGTRRRPRSVVRLGVARRVPLAPLVVAAAFVALPPLVLGEADVFRIGSVMIVAVAAIGLHMLVNWAGELSLAQAAVVGLPAFTVAKLAADWSVSPLWLLPIGIVVGAAAGLVIGLPSLRARGLQVALVTLAGGIAIERFLFTKPWLVGPPGGVAVPVPNLGPWTFTTSKALYPVLASVVVAAVAGAAMLYRSKVARAMAWVRDEPAAAAAFAIPVTTYRLAAYGLAGAYAGLAGGLSAVWVQRLTAGAFPFTVSFTYMVMVVLAGRGFVWGVVAAVALLEGGRVFASGIGPLVAYGGPVALILVITRYRAGLNGTGRQLMEWIRTTVKRGEGTSGRPSVTTVAGLGAIALGFLSIGLAWYHAGNTDQVWVQNQLLVSGGLVGLALVILGGLALATERIVRALEKRE